MANFKFPPPPPPPPKATSNDVQESYSSQRGGYNSRGDGGRGRGRGWQGRGRGNNNSNRGGSRGGNNQGHSNERPHGRGGYAQNQPQHHQQANSYAPQQTPAPANVPAGAYVNPAFAQAMAFISTPTGMQTMTAFANHMANGGPPPPVPQAPPPQLTYQSSPPQLGNKKRKREDNQSNGRPGHASPPAHHSQPKPKPPRAKAAPPPAVPSFGFSLPPVPKPVVQNVPKARQPGNDRKHKINLGLTATRQEELAHESSEEEDVDEEAAFAATEVKEPMVFEHNGQQISLKTPAELAAWIRDRRKQFPTQKRVQEKAREAVEKRAGELEFLRKISGKRKTPRDQPPPVTENQTYERQAPTMSKEAELDRLRKKLQDDVQAKKNLITGSKPNTSMNEASSKPSAIDLGLGYGTESDSNTNASSILSESSVLSSSSEDTDSDSDSAPEEEPSKIALAPINVPPPPPKPAPRQPETRICSMWERTGRCKMGHRCRFVHPNKAEKESKRITLYERMVEQELEKADRLALEAIKYLGQHGFLG